MAHNISEPGQRPSHADDHKGEGTEKLMASILWVIVTVGLLYGIVETVRRAANLFT